MAAGIVEGIDVGLVGYVEEMGETWHHLPEYTHVKGPVALNDVREILEYPVIKVPAALHAPDTDFHGDIVNDAFLIVDEKTGRPIYEKSVSGEYELHENAVFLDNLQASILDAQEDGIPSEKRITIESAGTLFALRIAFVNLLMGEPFHVKNDHSETVNRLMYYNAFGGRSLAVGAHSTRIVCNNTLMMAEAQAEANKSLGKFRHTKNAASRMRDHLVELHDIHQKAKEHRELLDQLAVIPMTVADMKNFTRALFPMPANSKRPASVTGKRKAITELFETLPDIQDEIAQTRYAALQAVTYYAGKEMGRGESDDAFSYFDSITMEKGARNSLNQSALRTLSLDDIPVVSDPVLVEA